LLEAAKEEKTVTKMKGFFSDAPVSDTHSNLFQRKRKFEDSNTNDEGWIQAGGTRPQLNEVVNAPVCVPMVESIFPEFEKTTPTPAPSKVSKERPSGISLSVHYKTE
jgi:hypothetical protein